MDTRHQLAKWHFLKAQKLSSKGRAAYLEQLGAEDPSLCVEVASLLEFEDESVSLRAQMPLDETPHPETSNAALRDSVWTGDSRIPELTIDRYALLREIGRGGQGVVYLAEDTVSKERVALKVVPILGSDRILRFFQREIALSSRILHPDVCPILDS